MFNHMVEVPIATSMDHEFFSDMIRVNFPNRTDDSIRGSCGSVAYIIQFTNDENVLLWMSWLVRNGFSFTYTFMP